MAVGLEKLVLTRFQLALPDSASGIDRDRRECAVLRLPLLPCFSDFVGQILHDRRSNRIGKSHAPRREFFRMNRGFSRNRNHHEPNASCRQLCGKVDNSLSRRIRFFLAHNKTIDIRPVKNPSVPPDIGFLTTCSAEAQQRVESRRTNHVGQRGGIFQCGFKTFDCCQCGVVGVYQ